ncbi:hypothetical protein SAMN04490248_108125 [Salinihabitans flavidus]|uniref:DUF1127 domain-containing protein n=1 Tax=Salinihabitans flavidus TaxID=569882 RepID=A0A1H8RER5_9RHOB|nr:hypothetical protein [Salinihabitans flavidus]SEO64880.1 hypothetical protein SAMN04490248_108125 [Salinihabitans flavidus]
MAHITSNMPAAATVLDALTAPFRAVGRFMILIGENNTQVRKAQYLQSLSDEELAKRGMTREEIVRRVFADKFYI